MVIHAVDVFTPNTHPVHTYIDREGDNLEGSLKDALSTPNTVISLSGPSKSGKTVLVERVVGRDCLITISGAELPDAAALWHLVLDWIGAPTATTVQAGTTKTKQGSVTVGAKGGIPFLAEASGQGSAGLSAGSSRTEGETFGRSGLTQVEKEIAGSAFVIFIDDFHYMDRVTQTEVAKQIRAGSGRGIRICVASVPHRSDDVVRSNPELRGRTAHIDTAFWAVDELAKIALRGFDVLNMDIDLPTAKLLAVEACGSPQLMQQICLQTCFVLSVRVAPETRGKVTLDSRVMGQILEQAAAQTDYSSLLRRMHQGAKTRGQERLQHQFKDGTEGDVYRAVLLALADGAPRMEFPWASLIERVEKVCDGRSPAGVSVSSACKQIEGFARSMYPTQRIVEWDDSAGAETLSIVDPYLLFYLRASSKLGELGRAAK